MHALNIEMMKSLRNIENAKVDLLMVNTHVTQLPTGQGLQHCKYKIVFLEHGTYLSIDVMSAKHTLSLVKFNGYVKQIVSDQMTYGLPEKYLNGSLEEVS